jgi:hypothetical protein
MIIQAKINMKLKTKLMETYYWGIFILAAKLFQKGKSMKRLTEENKMTLNFVRL